MRRFTVAILAGMLLTSPAYAQNSLQSDFSTMLTTTPVMVIPNGASLAGAGAGFHYAYVHVENVGVNTGDLAPVAAWCSYSLTTTLAPNVPGAIQLVPGGNVIDFNQNAESSHYVPSGPIWCVAASGTVPITAIAH